VDVLVESFLDEILRFVAGQLTDPTPTTASSSSSTFTVQNQRHQLQSRAAEQGNWGEGLSPHSKIAPTFCVPKIFCMALLEPQEKLQYN